MNIPAVQTPGQGDLHPYDPFGGNYDPFGTGGSYNPLPHGPIGQAGHPLPAPTPAPPATNPYPIWDPRHWAWQAGTDAGNADGGTDASGAPDDTIQLWPTGPSFSRSAIRKDMIGGLLFILLAGALFELVRPGAVSQAGQEVVKRAPEVAEAA